MTVTQLNLSDAYRNEKKNLDEIGNVSPLATTAYFLNSASCEAPSRPPQLKITIVY